MNKTIVIMISIIVIMLAIFTAIVMVKPNENNEEYIDEIKVAEEEILDECTEEYEYLNSQEIVETDSSEEKVSPNCSIILKSYYPECKHTTQKYLNVPDDLINKTEKQVKEIYSDWNIEKFVSNEIILWKEFEGECGEHYIVRDKEGQVVIYQILSGGKEVEVEKTDISTDYLPETDKINMREGIKVYGKDNLNQLIEDYE